ncbi:hypothetical protein HanRHA438_Chr15g0683571 [Helianthus annuus]|nr:hypothetical protein HanRHA438_Chr15g0683571 [Helianthus annuus]
MDGRQPNIYIYIYIWCTRTPTPTVIQVHKNIYTHMSVKLVRFASVTGSCPVKSFEDITLRCNVLHQYGTFLLFYRQTCQL